MIRIKFLVKAKAKQSLNVGTVSALYTLKNSQNIIQNNFSFMLDFFVIRRPPKLLIVSGPCTWRCATLSWCSPAIHLRAGTAWGFFTQLSAFSTKKSITCISIGIYYLVQDDFLSQLIDKTDS